MGTGIKGPSSFGISNVMDYASLGVVSSYLLRLPARCPPEERGGGGVQSGMRENKGKGRWSRGGATGARCTKLEISSLDILVTWVLLEPL